MRLRAGSLLERGTTHSQIVRAVIVGLAVFLAHLLYRVLSGDQYPGDYEAALSTAYALVHGIDPYGFTANPLLLPYPLPVALFGFPLLWCVGVVPMFVAGAMFIGVSAGLLSWSMLRADEGRRLALMLLSGPFWTAVIAIQWSPLIVAGWYIPALAPLMVLVKPQTAIPVAIARRPSTLGLLIAAGVLLASLLVYPTWPWRFLSMLGPYQSTIAAAILPLGPLLLLAALRWRDERARLLLLLSVLPHRTVYDYLPLWLVPRRWGEVAALTGLSWLVVLVGLATWPAMMVWPEMRWAVHILYLPALAFVLWPRKGPTPHPL